MNPNPNRDLPKVVWAKGLGSGSVDLLAFDSWVWEPVLNQGSNPLETGLSGSRMLFLLRSNFINNDLLAIFFLRVSEYLM